MRYLSILVTFFLWLSQTWSFIIDDAATDAKLVFSKYTTTNKAWNHTENVQCYKQTVTYINGCVTEDGCSINIPFTGSGITIYGLIGYATSFNAVIDDQPPAYYQHDGVPNPLQFSSLLYNFSLFDIQSMPYQYHVLEIDLVNTTGILEHADNDRRSWMIFDYAVVNETNAFPTSAPISTPTATPTPSPTVSKSHSVVGAAVGGTIGGIVALGFILFAFLYFRRKNTPESEEDFADGEVKTPAWNGKDGEDTAPQVLSVLPSQPRSDPPSSTFFGGDGGTGRAASPSPGTPALYPSTAPWEAAYSPYAQAAPTDIPTQTLPMSEANTIATRSSVSAPVENEHSDLLLRLYNLNVPADDLTRIIAALGGKSTVSSAEEAQTLLRLSSLNVPAGDIALILNAMRKRDRESMQINGGQGRDAPPVYHNKQD